jgi:hypothetical protein
MTRPELIDYRNAVAARHAAFLAQIDQIDPAPEDVESTHHQADAYAEALFLRAFTTYESDIEKLFLHYVTGGASLGGRTANSYLRVDDEMLQER